MTTSVFRSQGFIDGPPHGGASGAASPPSPPPPPHCKDLTAPITARRVRPARRFPARPPPSRRGLVMEEVKILKRSEDLRNPAGAPLEAVDAAALVVSESVFCQTFPLGPDPDSLPRRIAFIDLDMAFSRPGDVLSPSPSSLPFPSFSIKKPSLLT